MANNSDYKQLEEISNSNYKITDGEPHIKDWKVMLIEEKKIGDVDDLLFDVQSLKVHYIIVNLKDNMMGLGFKKVLIPISTAELNKEEETVLLVNVTAEQVMQLPAYTTNGLTMEMENAVRTIFQSGEAFHKNSNDSYTDANVNEVNFYNKRNERLQDDIVNPVTEESINLGKRPVDIQQQQQEESNIVFKPRVDNKHINSNKNNSL